MLIFELFDAMSGRPQQGDAMEGFKRQIRQGKCDIDELEADLETDILLYKCAALTFAPG